MKITNKEIENWIKPYATVIGDNLNIDISLRKTNPLRYFLRLTLPNNFDSYAIILHSYWINYNIPKDQIVENENKEKDLPEEDFVRVNWKEFYNYKNVQFDLDNAILNSVEWWKDSLKQMNNELYPADSTIDDENILSLVKVVNEMYGNQEIEFYYTSLITDNWENDFIYAGKINDLPSFLETLKYGFTPSLIYPKDRNWAINSDYDLSFSTIGGEYEFIKKLTKENKNEIIKSEY